METLVDSGGRVCPGVFQKLLTALHPVTVVWSYRDHRVLQSYRLTLP